MRFGNVIRVLAVAAVLLSSLTLAVTPAGAVDIPEEWQDPEWVCVDFYNGEWLDGECLITRDNYWWYGYFISQGFYFGGYTEWFNALLAENGCTTNEGLVVEMFKYFVGPGPDAWVYELGEIIGCAEPGQGGIGGRAGDTDDAGTLSLAQPRNGFIQYDAGTCSGTCKVSPDLPVNADKYIGEIPGTVSATLYVQLGGGTGSYSACFWGEGQIYQRISGTWQAVATSIANGMSCAAGAGDGTFAFVEN